jgi:hypothetical protein
MDEKEILLSLRLSSNCLPILKKLRLISFVARDWLVEFYEAESIWLVHRVSGSCREMKGKLLPQLLFTTAQLAECG